MKTLRRTHVFVAGGAVALALVVGSVFDSALTSGAVETGGSNSMLAQALGDQGRSDQALAAESARLTGLADHQAAIVQAQQQAAADAAAVEAERQAAAERAARDAVRGSVADPKGAAAQIAAAEFGWSGAQFQCLDKLWTKESGWNYQAHNRSSGAHGIPQALPGSKMASAGADWQTNPATQIRWGLGYIRDSYGTPCSAWSHSQRTNWY